MEYSKIDGHSFYNMLVNACNKLEQQKEFVNSLNVFPVPDGDTGTNMSMTFRNAVTEIRGMKNNNISEISNRLAKGALMGARGNSGVILSQILRGIAKGLEGLDSATAEQFANGIMEGSKSAYKAVMRPTEGTILTIVRAAGESAVNSNKTDAVELLGEICAKSEEMLNRTPEMLPVLKKAKVVDAGGMGLLIILKGMYESLLNNLESELDAEQSVVKEHSPAANVIDVSEITYGYCTEFFINSQNPNVEEFKSDLTIMGDSMIVVAMDDIVKVHIHTNDPGLVLSKAIKLGDLTKIKIDNMREQHRKILELEYDASVDKDEPTIDTSNEEKNEYGFISVALGEGIEKIFKDLGVDYVIEGGQTMNPSTQDILKAINNINANNIFILPNNKNIIMAASQAAELSEKNVIVIPTKTIPQGITCLTEFSADSSVDKNIEIMNEAMAKVTSGSITYAVRETEMDGKQIKEGDILGLVEGTIKEVGTDIYEVCKNIIDQIVTDDSELISIYYGKDCDKDKVNQLVSTLEDKYSDIDVQCNSGEQPLYYFLVSAE
ncbi:MAG: DAK2 domain-containing protein [Bacillota bacterium]|nr:DAK2 domain-containing protein [Bacillota bacterium]